jgi:serine/threonine-protein kinase
VVDVEALLRDALVERYRIDRKVGAGGMATVWLAQDLKHERQVALKVLHPELAAVMGAERFLQEIRTTANLQHPHILPLFDSGTTDATSSSNGHQFLFYVMPFVEGQSLRERLDKEKQLPVEEAVRIARAVAAALDHAHQKGIIHRDIKPENILLQGDQPMVADFGIALAVSAAGGGRLTETGLSLGTPFYMSPEQASADRDLTPAADVYSLGAMLYEMLAGEPPHTGTSAQAVLARILTNAPARVISHRSVPPHVDAVIAKSLERLPADRFESAGAFIKALDDPSFRYGDAEAAAVVSHAAADLWKRVSAIVGVAAIVMLGLAAWGWLRPTPPRPVTQIRVDLPAPENTQWFPQGISPNGRYLVAGPPFGQGGPHLLSLDDFTVRQLDEVTNNGSVRFSQDGTRFTAAAGAGRLTSFPMSGGPGVTLAEEARAGTSAWDEEGRVWFVTRENELARVPGEGGAVETLLTLDSGHSWYVSDVLPGSELVLGHRVPTGQPPWSAELVVYDPRRDSVVALGPGLEPRVVGSKYLLYWLADEDTQGSGALMAARFDQGSGTLRGSPVPLIEGVAGTMPGFYGGMSASGNLVYTTNFSLRRVTATLVGRAGDRRRLPGLDSGLWVSPQLSPDGKSIALRQRELRGGFRTSSDVWVYTLPIGPVSRRTFGGDGIERGTPAWSPDGKRILYSRSDSGSRAVFAVPADGSAQETRVVALPSDRGTTFPLSIAPDGVTIASVGSRGLYLIGPGDTAGTVFIPGGSSPAISPDGRWIAYTSRESGRSEVYVQSFPTPGAKYQISLDGADNPLWSRSGRVIFYQSVAVAGQSQTWEVFEARVDPGPPFEVKSRGPVFGLPLFVLTDAFPGDSLFLGVSFTSGNVKTMLVLDFLEELRAKLGK